MDSSQLTFGLLFFRAGIVSFLCVLPLMPVYLAQLVGQSVYQSVGDQEDVPETNYIHACSDIRIWLYRFRRWEPPPVHLGGPTHPPVLTTPDRRHFADLMDCI
jgi:hypothetical protein